MTWQQLLFAVFLPAVDILARNKKGANLAIRALEKTSIFCGSV
jgi:hypothetical protein